MTSVDSNFNFLCGRPHGAGPPVHLSLTPSPPPCGRHKWMAPYMVCPDVSFEEPVNLVQKSTLSLSPREFLSISLLRFKSHNFFQSSSSSSLLILAIFLEDEEPDAAAAASGSWSESVLF